MLGCVDASSATCHYNLKRKRSILIFIGGEKEQLMTEPGSHKIYLLNRKGFVKLALQYGCDLVPMVGTLLCAVAMLLCPSCPHFTFMTVLAVRLRRERGIRNFALHGR